MTASRLPGARTLRCHRHPPLSACSDLAGLISTVECMLLSLPARAADGAPRQIHAAFAEPGAPTWSERTSRKWNRRSGATLR